MMDNLNFNININNTTGEKTSILIPCTPFTRKKSFVKLKIGSQLCRIQMRSALNMGVNILPRMAPPDRFSSSLRGVFEYDKAGIFQTIIDLCFGQYIAFLI
jgi:hypothetical protein